MMRWLMGSGWFGFDLNTSSLTFYSSMYDPADKLSQAFGFYASDSSFSKVYLLNWKYRNISPLPSTITYDYSDLAKYDFYYDMPETYPESGLNSMNAFWFTWENIGGFQGWNWDVHEIPAGLNAKYYLAPWNATYWGVYMPWYKGWDTYSFGPLQEWEIGRHYPYPQIPPESGETGSLILGNFQFAPYIPGLSLDILENGPYTIHLRGDIWENLVWPHWQWYRIYPPPQGLISPYPQNQKPYYYLYVDNLLAASGTFGRIDVDESLGIWWDNIENSWSVTGGEGRLEIHMPSLATISKWTTYELSFNLADNVHIPPIFNNILMPLSYSPDENIVIQLVTPDNLASVTLEYSFDNGVNWKTAQENQSYLIPCEAADWLTIRINVIDGYGNSLRYLSNPVALCGEVILSVPERVYIRPSEAVELSGRLTTIEGRGLKGLAVGLSDGENIRYTSSSENGAFTFTFAAPSAEGVYNFTLTSMAAGVYDNSQTQVLLTVDGTPPAKPILSSPENNAVRNVTIQTFTWIEPEPGITYDIQIDDEASFTPPYVHENLGLSDNSYTYALADGIYYWRVRAVDNAYNASGWSDNFNLRIDTTLPPVPALLWPTSGQNINDNTPTLDWSDVSDLSPPITYGLQVDNDLDFSTPFVDLTGLMESTHTTPELPEGVWYWRVNVRDNAGNTSDWSASRSFKVDVTPPPAPALVWPVDGMKTNDNTPTFKWTAVIDASLPLTYDILVDNDPSFTSPEITVSGLVDNNYAPMIGLMDENYFWKVQALDNAGNYSSWSTTWTFIIDTTPPTPPADIFVWPDNVNINDNTPDLDWNAFSDLGSPIKYDIQVDDDSDFSSPFVWISNIMDDNYEIMIELAEGVWYWRVKAKDNIGNAGGWYSSWFRVDVTPPVAPTLVWPADGENINDNKANLDWGPVTEYSLPVAYRVQVDDDPDFSSPIVDVAGLPDDNYQITTELAEGVWYWQVRARDNAGNPSAWTGSWFRVDITPPTAPLLTWPADSENINNTTPTLGWNQVDDISKPVLYYVALSDDPTFPYENYNSDWILGNNWTTPALTEGLWYWRVSVKDNASNVGENSIQRSFRVDITKPPMSSLALPADGQNLNDNTPNLTWSTVWDNSRPVLYRVWIDDDPDFSSPEVDSGWILDNEYTTTELPEKVYYWRVGTKDDAGNIGDNSGGKSFRVDITAPGTPSLVWPDNHNNINNTTPNLDWGLVSDLSTPITYDILIDNDLNFSSPEINVSGITDDNYQVPEESPLVESIWYYWKVRARDNAGNVGSWSISRSFKVDVTSPAAPSLISPADGEDINDDTPTLEWSGVTDSSMPVTYSLQVDNDNDSLRLS
jgi:hypothetical protein